MSNTCVDSELTVAPQHETLMQLEAIIFASETAVSLARLEEALQNKYSKTELRLLLQQLSVLQQAAQLN